MPHGRLRVLCSRDTTTWRCSQTGIGRSLDLGRSLDIGKSLDIGGASPLACLSDCLPVGVDVCVRTDVRFQTQACAVCVRICHLCVHVSCVYVSCVCEMCGCVCN